MSNAVGATVAAFAAFVAMLIAAVSTAGAGATDAESAMVGAFAAVALVFVALGIVYDGREQRAASVAREQQYRARMARIAGYNRDTARQLARR